MGQLAMAHTKQGLNDFHARVQRIKNPRNTSYYDPETDVHVPKHMARKKAATSQKETLIGKFLVSIIIGAIALLFAQVVRIRYFGLIEQSDVVLFLEIFVAFWATVMLSSVLNRRKVLERIGQVAGVALMLTAGHNLIWNWPEPMTAIYTTEYVDQVLKQTTQNSVVYRGAVFGL